MTGLVQTATPDAVTKAMTPVEVTNELAISSISARVKYSFDQAKIAKNLNLERLLRCDRQRKGIYDPDRLAEISKTGGSDIFMMITDIKCRAAEAWIRDVLFALGDEPWTLDTSHVPELPKDERSAIIQMVLQEAQALQQMGVDVNPKVFQLRMGEIRDQVVKALREAADKACERMRDTIADQLNQAGFEQALSEFYTDFCTFPSAFLKGPVIQRERQLTWGPDFQPVVVYKPTRKFYRVSPYDIYPSPGAVHVQDGYLCERVRYEVRDLDGLKDVPGYRNDQIDAVIETYGRGGLKNWLTGDMDRDILTAHHAAWLNPDDHIEGIEFWGKATGAMLDEWGMKGLQATRQYEITCITIGSYTIKCTLNPDPLGRRPYFKASFEEQPGSYWCICPPEMMRDNQIMCNAAARALANNMSIASGPQVEVTVDRLPDGESVTSMFPWKIWQTSSDKTGGGQPAIHFFQPKMMAQELMSVFQNFSRLADEVTGIPNYVYGSGQQGGAGRTASGLAMLMDNAAKGIKQAVGNIDAMVTQVIEAMYYHNMLFNPDPSIKGDMNVRSRGAVGMLLKEQLQERRQKFLAETANPIDAPIMGQHGRLYLLRETARPLGLDVDKIVPSDEALRVQQAVQALQQQQEQQQPLENIQFHRGPDGAVEGASIHAPQPPASNQGGPRGQSTEPAPQQPQQPAIQPQQG